MCACWHLFIVETVLGDHDGPRVQAESHGFKQLYSAMSLSARKLLVAGSRALQESMNPCVGGSLDWWYVVMPADEDDDQQQRKTW